MPSFDIVCRVDVQEVDNAVNQVAKEISQRFDFRGGQSKITLEKDQSRIKIIADDDMKLRSMHQILEQKLVKRQVDLRMLQYGNEQEAGGNKLLQTIELKGGLEKNESKEVTKAIKDMKLKVSAEVQADQIRVTAKKIDDLQTVMTNLRESDLDFPLEFINMRR